MLVAANIINHMVNLCISYTKMNPRLYFAMHIMTTHIFMLATINGRDRI